MKKLVIFDLDGTLIDSVADIASSVNRLRTRHELSALDTPTVRGFIGNGVRQLVNLSMAPPDRPTLDAYLAEYVEIYRNHLLDETIPYPGVETGLKSLMGKATLAILTNKPGLETDIILKGLGLDHFFETSIGGDTLARRKPDPIGIETLCSSFSVDKTETLMVGDSIVDQLAAANAGVDFCLVSYGLGSAELMNGNHDSAHIVGSLTELGAIVTS